MTPALRFVSAKDGGAILSDAENNGGAVAYEITAALASEASSAYTEGCRLADLNNRRLSERVWAVPRIVLEREGGDALYVKRLGLAVYNGNLQSELLLDDLLLIWRMVAGYTVKGNVRLGDRTCVIGSAEYSDKRLEIRLESGDVEAVENALNEGIGELFERYRLLMHESLGDVKAEEITAEVSRSVW